MTPNVFALTGTAYPAWALIAFAAVLLGAATVWLVRHRAA